MEEVDLSDMVKKLSSLDGKKYVRFTYYDGGVFWYTAEDANRLLDHVRIICDSPCWELDLRRKEDTGLGYTCFHLNDFVGCAIYDTVLADEFEQLAKSIPYELDGKIYNDNILP